MESANRNVMGPSRGLRPTDRRDQGLRDNGGAAALDGARPAGPALVAAVGRRPVACWCGWSGTVDGLAPGGRCPTCRSSGRLEDSVAKAAEKAKQLADEKAEHEAKVAAARAARIEAARLAELDGKGPASSGLPCERGCGALARPRSGDRGLFPTLCEPCHEAAGKHGGLR